MQTNKEQTAIPSTRSEGLILCHSPLVVLYSEQISSIICSDVEEDGWLVGVLHLLDTEDGAVDLIVDPGQVGDGGSLSNSAELVVDATVAQADPALVRAQVGHRDATQVSANGRAAHDRRVTGIRDGGLGFLVELGGGGEGVGLVDLGFGETSDEDEVTVPGGLEHLTGGQLRNVELLVGVTHVSVTSDHLVVQHSHQGLNSENVVSEDKALNHVKLGAANLVVTVFLIPGSVGRIK